MPTEPRSRLQSRSFKVDLVRRSDYVPHGPTALRKAYRKFGITSTDFTGTELSDFKLLDTSSLTTAKSATEDSSDTEQTGAVSATSINGDQEFVSPVNIGGQTLPMNFDSGSADMWVLSSRLPATQKQGRTVFEEDNSTTFKQVQNGTFSISYGDSSKASGLLGKDTVSVGGVEFKEQTFGLATEASDVFIEDTASNGLVGLGFSSLNTFKPGPQKTFFENVAPTLDEPLFTARLRPDGVGQYEFGKIDETKYTGNLVNVSVDSSDGFWLFQSAQYSIDGGAFNTITQTTKAIADTGTSLLLISPEVVQAYYAKVAGAVYAGNVQGWIFPCASTLPSLSIAIGNDYAAKIPGKLINYAQIGTNTTTGATLCYGGVQSNSGGSMSIYGDVFLKALFVVFDQRGPSLGFATPT
ncbi:uncharacterized protein N7511_002438 [Penicillium nucicola]|uniref:uncharacterized protein n=1 Tax=Penicillium nucicola TaxID=1850975 RepID=UPI0025456006|nr:uncharacterized protein N7511_002438 [Penicillium nucicola]KAJ5770387.1 hypothetical protein N7511_002438 [Penicillium nucicola]